MADRAAYRIESTPRRVYGARDRIARESHALVVQTTEGSTALGNANRHWFGDLRRGRMNIYGGLLRFIDHLHRRGVSMETALLIPEWLDAYIRETWGGTAPAPQSVPLELLRTGEHDRAA